MHQRTLIVVLLVACLVVPLVLAGCGQAAAPADTVPTPADTPKSANPDVVSAEAAVVPWQETDLSFRASGRITRLLVAVGDRVEKGQELARLDSRDLELAVRQAEGRLQSAQAQLAKARAGARAEEIAVAETAVSIARANANTAERAVKVAEGYVGSALAGVSSAQAGLDRAKAGASPEQLNAASAVLQEATAAVKQAQAAYDRIKGSADAALMPQALQLEQATNEYNRARASYQNLLNGATPAEINVYQQQVVQAQVGVQVAQAQLEQARAQAQSAQAQVAQAQAQLDLLKAGSRPEDVAVAQAAVTEATIAVDQARNALDDIALRAPFTGTVGTVPVNEGQLVGPQVVVVRLGDLSRLQVQTKDLSEADINHVAIGQDVSLSLDALPGQKFTGKVSRISPVASDRRGDQVYTVTADVDAPPDSGLRWGMTAFVDIRVR